MPGGKSSISLSPFYDLWHIIINTFFWITEKCIFNLSLSDLWDSCPLCPLDLAKGIWDTNQHNSWPWTPSQLVLIFLVFPWLTGGPWVCLYLHYLKSDLGNDLSILEFLQDLGSWKIDILGDAKPEWGWGGGGMLGAECAGWIMTSRFTSLLTRHLPYNTTVSGPTGYVGNSEPFTVK